MSTGRTKERLLHEEHTHTYDVHMHTFIHAHPPKQCETSSAAVQGHFTSRKRFRLPSTDASGLHGGCRIPWCSFEHSASTARSVPSQPKPNVRICAMLPTENTSSLLPPTTMYKMTLLVTKSVCSSQTDIATRRHAACSTPSQVSVWIPQILLIERYKLCGP